MPTKWYLSRRKKYCFLWNKEFFFFFLVSTLELCSFININTWLPQRRPCTIVSLTAHRLRHPHLWVYLLVPCWCRGRVPGSPSNGDPSLACCSVTLLAALLLGGGVCAPVGPGALVPGGGHTGSQHPAVGWEAWSWKTVSCHCPFWPCSHWVNLGLGTSPPPGGHTRSRVRDRFLPSYSVSLQGADRSHVIRHLGNHSLSLSVSYQVPSLLSNSN